MYKGSILTATAATANTNIPFVTVFNTNANTVPITGAIQILTPGYYDITAKLVVTGTTAETISAMLANGADTLPESMVSADITPATGVKTLVINDTIRVEPVAPGQYVTLGVQLQENATINTGLLVIEKRK